MTKLEAMYKRLDQHVERRMREARTAGLALALFDRENVLRVSTHGFMNLETRDPVTPTTLFEIGSVSKTFTAVVVLQAMEQGLLDRHAPVVEYLPWFQVRSRHAPITIHHLLSHSAGIIAMMDMSPDARGAVWSLRGVEPGFAPGERFHYSEVGYQALTLVLEAVHRRPYADVVRTGILEPLGMTDTTAAITHDIRPRLARGYQTLYDDRPPHASHPLVPAPWLEMGSGDGGIASTAGDMAHLGRMLLNQGQGSGGPILSATSYRLMTTPVVAEAEYGYGIYVFDDDGATLIGHSGDMPGYDAYLWLDVDHGLGIALLVAHPYPSGLSWKVLDLFRASVLGRPLPALAPADPTHVEDAADFAGTYRAAGRALTLIAEGDRLLLEHDGGRIALEKRGHDRFYVNHPGFDRFLLCFGRAGDDRVAEACHGPDWYVGDPYVGPRDFPYPSEWDAYPGHYRAHNPWASNFRVVVRRGELLLTRPDGDEEPLTSLGGGEFRVGEEAWSPERLCFDQIADGQALRATLSSCHYYRFFTH